MYKTQIHPNGQWELKKYDEESYGHIHDTHTSTPAGEHTVEVHPHIDHLYNIKGQIKDSGKDKLKVGHLKQVGFDKNFLKQHVPKDGDGWITEDMIDKHIDNLPKQKVNIQVAPYKMGAQQHRDGQQHIVSVQLHEDHEMEEEHWSAWEHVRSNQHKFDGISGDNQIGWGRIDPKGHHWHVDEIQSDFNNPDKYKTGLERVEDEEAAEQGYHDYKYVEHSTELDEKARKDMVSRMSMGHDDPQHLIHSAVNQLARKHNIQSMSMDMPQDQAKQSWLRAEDDTGGEIDSTTIFNAVGAGNIPEGHEGNMDARAESLAEEHGHDINFKKIKDKLGINALRDMGASHADPEHGNSWMYYRNHGGFMDEHVKQLNDVGSGKVKNEYVTPNTAKSILGASNEELNALSSYLERLAEFHHDAMHDHLTTAPASSEENKEDKKIKPPVHQINTYNKRPKKLGMKPHDKSKVMGEDPKDQQKEVQYHKLHKSLLKLKEALKEC